MKAKPLRVSPRFRSLLLLAALVIPPLAQLEATAAGREGVRPYSAAPSKDALRWADKQLKKMSLDEKIGQMISVGINATYLNQDSDAFRLLQHQVVDNHVGGIILFKGPVYESVMLVNRLTAREVSPVDFRGSRSRRGHAVRRHG